MYPFNFACTFLGSEAIFLYFVLLCLFPMYVTFLFPRILEMKNVDAPYYIRFIWIYFF